jgi:predicted Holliday junction resolvase-like endonuclease
MPSKTAHQDIIAALKKGNFFIECPETLTNVSLKHATIFDRNNFSEEALAYYEERLAFVKAEKLRLKKLKEIGASRSEIGAQAINIGFILERLAPTLTGFPFSHHDCRSLFDPIDYVIFEGLSKNGRVDNIIFTDIKTGNARLKPRQREIRTAVEKKKISFKTY